VPLKCLENKSIKLRDRAYDPYAAAGFFGMSLDILQRVYGHHNPNHQRAVGEALTGRTVSAQLGQNKTR
jgi:hypothetical protein